MRRHDPFHAWRNYGWRVYFDSQRGYLAHHADTSRRVSADSMEGLLECLEAGVRTGKLVASESRAHES